MELNRDKQIEEMAWLKCCCHSNKGICGIDGKPCDLDCGSYHEAEALYTAGYRKSQDVAEEIFAEIEENLNNLIRYYKEKRKYVTEIEYSELEQRYCDIKIRTFEERLLKIAELKKKYIGKDTNVTTKESEKEE